MMKRFQLPLPDGRICEWVALDKPASPVFRKLRNAAGLTDEKREAQFRCQISEYQPSPNPERIPLPGSALAFQLNGDEVHAFLRPRPDRLGFQMRQLFFLGLLPLLLRGEAALVHGALAEHNGEGLLFCGPSGIGKSTLAEKLKGDYRALSDDCALLTRSGDRYFAQPVPTWSIWISGKSGVRTSARQAVPLKRIYLLERGDDLLADVDRQTAFLGLMPAFSAIINCNTNPGYPAILRQKLMMNAFEFLTAISAGTELRRLRLGLDNPPESLLAGD